MPEHHAPAAPVRAFWSGTITFGLVSIPVDFYAAARPRQKSMKLVDAEGHPLGREYTREDEDRPLADDEIVRGFETDQGKTIVVTEQELEAAAPETSRDIDLYRFVPLAQIPPSYFVRPYFLAPGMRSAKAYSLLAQTMERTGKVGIGRLVMRGHEYLVAIIAEGGALRAETLRYFDELRTPGDIGLPAPSTPPKKLVQAFGKAIQGHMAHKLALHELEDQEAEALHELAERKRKKHADVIALGAAEDETPEEGGAEIVDLVQLLRRSLGPSAPAPAPVRAPSPGHAMASDLEGKTREELYEMATGLEIPGRSKMKKGQLVKAVRAASDRPKA